MSFSAHNTKASRLTGQQVLAIRQKYADGGYTYSRLAREYKVSLNTISNIVNGVTWQTLPQIEPRGAIDLAVQLSQRRLLDMLAADPPPNDPGLADRLTADIARTRKAQSAVDEQLTQLTNQETPK